ncbi:MAG: IMPACT family protein [Dethiobacteria bacterium]|jgi:uncharacterized YigZ family protein
MYRYKTIAQTLRTKIAVGACRFYASLSPCVTEEEARSFISRTKEELPGATHHAFAYRLGFGDRLLARCDDAGEPAGTAGPPMLAVLEKVELTNVVLVGTRYFGGVKLGVGGLIRAYRACAEAGVNEAHILEKELMSALTIHTPYDYLGAVLREVEAGEGKVVKFDYGQGVNLEIAIPFRQVQALPERIASASQGKAYILEGKN